MRTLSCMLHFALALGLASPVTTLAAVAPGISIEEAISKGRAYVASNDAQLRGCRISKVEYHDAKEPSDRYWSIFWNGRASIRDCFAELRVFPDGTVIRVVGY